MSCCPITAPMPNAAASAAALKAPTKNRWSVLVGWNMVGLLLLNDDRSATGRRWQAELNQNADSRRPSTCLRAQPSGPPVDRPTAWPAFGDRRRDGGGDGCRRR